MFWILPHDVIALQASKRGSTHRESLGNRKKMKIHAGFIINGGKAVVMLNTFIYGNCFCIQESLSYFGYKAFEDDDICSEKHGEDEKSE